MRLHEFRVYGDHVLLRVEEESVVTAGGIVIPEQARERRLSGEIVAAGPRAPDWARPGLRTLYERSREVNERAGIDQPRFEGFWEEGYAEMPGLRALYERYAGSEVVFDDDESVVHLVLPGDQLVPVEVVL